jgi:hypothetical protein
MKLEEINYPQRMTSDSCIFLVVYIYILSTDVHVLLLRTNTFEAYRLMKDSLSHNINGCEACSLALREECRLRVFENRS